MYTKEVPLLIEWHHNRQPAGLTAHVWRNLVIRTEVNAVNQLVGRGEAEKRSVDARPAEAISSESEYVIA